MKERLKGTLTSIGCAVPIVGTSIVSLASPDTTLNTIGDGTVSGLNGLSSSANGTSVKSMGTTEVNSGDATLGVLAVGSLAAGVTAISPTSLKTKNDAPFDLMEKRANKVYDKYNKNHIPSDQRGKGIIIADNPKTATICNEIFNKTFVSRDHLILNIKSFLSAAEETLVKYDLSVGDKEKLENTASLLKELDAAFTKKKMITLSTKDNEMLLFVLDSFRKHQENKKSTAKKLVKEKE